MWTGVSTSVQAECVFLCTSGKWVRVKERKYEIGGVWEHRSEEFQDLALENPVEPPESSLSPSHSVYSNSKTRNSSFSPCPGGLLLPHHFGLVSLSIHVSEQFRHVQYQHSSLTPSAGFLYHSPPTSSQAGSNQLRDLVFVHILCTTLLGSVNNKRVDLEITNTPHSVFYYL